MDLSLPKWFRAAKGLPRRLGKTLIPKRAQLPLMFWWQDVRQTLEPELLFVLRQKKKSGIAIDVGANQGLYSYALAKVFDHVEAFEPNSSALAKLSRYRSHKITIHEAALSRNQSEAILYAPVTADGVEYAGWGSLHREMLPQSDSVRSRTVPTRSLDSYHFENVEFIKIDVEGHELPVLEGATETIARCRPLILIEVKPASRLSAWDFLLAQRYQCCVLRNGGLQSVQTTDDFVATLQENFFWVPDQSSTWPRE